MKPADLPTCPGCGHMLVAEPHYSHGQLALVFQCTPATLIEWIRAGRFGRLVTHVGRDFFVPLSGYQHFVREHGVFSQDDGTLKPVIARTPGELRRKATLRSAPRKEAA